jgi:hypothetical protein
MSVLAPTRFIIAYFTLIGAFIALGGLALAMLSQIGRLPAPPLTATDCIDEKFRFLNQTDIRAPDLVAVGSSVSWRNLDFAQLGVGGMPLNAATCYLHVHETGFMARFAIDAWPTARTLLIVLAMRDFKNCTGPAAFFDRDAAMRYVQRDHTGWLLYFLNFRPKIFASAILGEKPLAGQAPGTSLLEMDRFGSGPIRIRPPDVREDVEIDPGCFAPLREMAQEVRSRGRRLAVVLMPPMPAWIAAYDPAGERDAGWRRMVSATLDGTQAVLIDAAAFTVGDTAFTDPAHFHWEAVPIFMDWLRPRLGAAISLSTGSHRPSVRTSRTAG